MLKSLELTNFRSFLGHHHVDFIPNTLTVVQGENIDTQGESASGKSSLLLAIAYALGICPYSQKDLQNWASDDPMQVTLGLDLGGDYLLKRGKGVSLEGPEGTITGSKEVEAFICQKTGLNLDQLAFVLYKAQGENVYFLDKTNSEKRDFLAHVLGLEKFETEIVTNNALLSKEEQTLVESVALHTVYQQEKAKIFTDLQHLSTPSVPAEPVVDEAFKTRHEQAKISLEIAQLQASEVNIATTRKLADLHDIFANQPVSSEVSVVRTALAELEIKRTSIKTALQVTQTQKKELDQSLADVNGAEQRLPLKKQNLVDIENALFSLRSGKCPTCSQAWASVDKESDLEIKKVDLSQEIASTTEEIKQKPTLQSLLAVQDKIRITTEAALVEIQNEFNDLTAQLDTLQKEQRANYTQGYNQAVNEQKQANDAVAEAQKALDGFKKQEKVNKQAQDLYLQAKSLYERQLVEYNTKQELFNKRIIDLDQKLLDVTQRITFLNKNIAYFKDRADFLKTFLNYIFVDILNEIAEEANAYLKTIPNAEDITVAFASERSTAKGNLKQEVLAVVTIDGQPRPFKSGCSGGQQTTLRLVVELAVRNVLQRRCGKVWGTFLLDEQFQGLDLISKTACMQVLQDFAKNHVVLAIEHDTVINASAHNVLKVVKKGGVSNIV